MKKLITLLATFAMFAAVSVSLAGCSDDKSPELDGNHRNFQSGKPVFHTFRISLSGDYIDQSEEPLFRAAENSTYVGINVTRKEKGMTNPPLEHYAYGVFTTTAGIQIDLESGYIYEFEATILKDGIDKLFKKNKRYDAPFRYRQEEDTNGTNINYPDDQNDKFQYYYNTIGTEYYGYLCELSSGSVFVEMQDQPNYPISYRAKCKYPRLDRFYSKLQNIDPEVLIKSEDPIEIKMHYKCFGLKIDAHEIPDGTTLTVRDVNYTVENTSKSDEYIHLMFPQDLVFSNDGNVEWESIYSVNKLDDDSELTFELEFTWSRGVGKQEKFNTQVKVEPGIKKILQVRIQGEANNKYTGNILFSNLDTELEDYPEIIDKDFTDK